MLSTLFISLLIFAGQAGPSSGAERASAGALALLGVTQADPRQVRREAAQERQLAAQKAEAARAEALERLTLTSGECGTQVERLNARLVRLRYLPRSLSSECYTEATQHAVMALQKWEGLTRDGIYGPESAEAIIDAKRPEAPDAAGTRVDVSLERQLAVVIEGKRVVRVISISSGAPGFETPQGSFSVYRKELMSWSTPYETWMPFASYFTGGYALHESADVPGHPASHGCIRVPAAFAEWLYGIAGYGVEVRILA